MSDEFGTYKTSEIQALRTQVESLRRERDDLNELYVSTEEKLLVATRELDQAMAACAVKHIALERWSEAASKDSNDQAFAALKDNPGQPIIDQLHAYHAGVVAAVKALEDDRPSFTLQRIYKALDHLRPLVTPKEEGK